MKKLWVVLAALFLSVLSGAAAFAAPDERVAPDEQYTIYAHASWQAINEYAVYIPQGQRVWVSPHGSWSNGSPRETGPQGYTPAQSTGFMPYCKYPRTPNLPFGRLIAMTRVSDTNFRIWDAGHARYIYGPGYLWFRMNERDGECLKNNYGYLRVDIYFR